MKKIITTFFPLFIFFFCYSQNQKIENEIRQMEQKRVAAFLNKDTATLLKIWADDYFVNRPAGVVSTRDQVLSMVLNDTISFKKLEFEIEKIIVKKNFVIVMGSDTADPGEKSPYAGKILHRRFTHIWSNESDSWRLLGRHANILCE
ncbi:nuclear transport factor 2 family protein [Terrimonas alba]|uniref:nuclear transport factor 2 family protein n=1 Tax=Terrimonas alba TaxID=3349636 RepID=UPI0035F388C4